MPDKRQAVTVAVVAAALLCAGCGGDAPATSPATSASTVPSSSPPSNQPPTRAEQAAKEATATVLMYRQIGIDLFSGARGRINDLDDVAVGDLLAKDRKDVQQNLVKGWRAEDGAKVVLASAEPIKVDLDADPPTVRIRACIDLTGITFTQPDGTKTQGTRGKSDYILVKTEHLPAPGWAVRKVVVLKDDSC